MTKEYRAWCVYKSNLENIVELPPFRVREIWRISIGINIGIEEDGKNEAFERPVLILRKFSKNHILGLPLTSKFGFDKNHYVINLHGISRSILLSQARTFSAKRLLRYVGRINESVFDDIQRKFIDLILEKQNPRDQARDLSVIKT